MPRRSTTHFLARKRLIATAISACFVSAPAWSNPTAPQVVSGSASFNQQGKLLSVSNSNGAIINWNTFSIGADETTRFNQASASSSVLNRVIANDPSVLLGTLSSNGKVWLVNPSGILVGQGAKIDVAGFVASTLNVRNEDFLAGRLTFGDTPNAGSVENYGRITTPSGGSVYLVAPEVDNHGIINAPNGEVMLAAGQTVELVDTGTPGVKVDITGAEGNATNLGEILVEAGRIGMAGVLVKNSGKLNASSVVKEGGRIFLKASRRIEVDDAGRIVADGTKGGEVIVKTEKEDKVAGELVAHGVISAQGDGSKGSGGFVETSAAKVDLNGASVTTRGGNWLIDPNDFTIAATGGDITGATLAANLGSGDVTIETATQGHSGAGDIFVNDSVVKTGATDTTLTLSAVRSIAINASISSSSSKLHVNLFADSGGAGDGAIAMNSGSSISSDGGNVTLTGGINGAGFAVGTADNPVGVKLDNASISAGAGNIVIRGRGYDVGNNNRGVDLINSASLTTTGGSVLLTGEGGAGSYSYGAYLSSASVVTDGGNLDITGWGGLGGDGGSGKGISIYSSTLNTGRSDAGAGGSVTLVGHGSSGTGYDTGVYLQSASITTGGGSLGITGNGNGSGSYNYGIHIYSSSLDTSKSDGAGGDITLTGTGGDATGYGGNAGVYLEYDTSVTSGGGNVTLTGTGGNGDSNNKGVYIDGGEGGVTVATGGGALEISGTGGGTGSYNYGVYAYDTTLDTSNQNGGAGGAITVTGTGANGADYNSGVYLDSGTSASTDGTVLNMTGTAGGSGPNSYGIDVSSASLDTSKADGTGANLSLASANNVNLGAITSGGDIDISAANGITQNSDLKAYGNVSLTANANGGQGNFVQNSGWISNVGTLNPGNITINAYDIQVGAADSRNSVILNAAHDIKIVYGVLGGDTAQNYHVDDASFSYTLPFGFTYYGVPYTAMYVSSNGIITFGGGTSRYTNSDAGLIAGVDYTPRPTIAPAWSDWVTWTSAGSNKDIYISQPSAGALAVRWNVANYDDTAYTANFQAVLSQSGNIQFNYGAATALAPDYTATIGVSAGDGIHYTLSALNNPASLNYLPSTQFNYDVATGNYVETSGSSDLGGGSINALAGVSMVAAGILNINSAISGATIQGQGTGINLDATAALKAGGAGDAIVLNAGTGAFTNNAGTNALSNTGGGRWLIWTVDPTMPSLGGLAEGFRQYNATYGVTAPDSRGSGLNGLMFSDPGTIAPTISGTMSKVYDGTAVATGLTLTGSSAYGDTISTGFNYVDKNVGTAKAIDTSTFASGVFHGAIPVYGVSFNLPDGGNITPRSLTLTATAANKVYDGTTAASVTYSDDRVTGDVLSVAGSASFADKNVGTGKSVSVSGITLSGTDAGNYSLTGSTATASADVTARRLTVTADAKSKVYGETDPSFTYTVGATGTGTGLVTGDSITGSLARVAGETVAGGPYAINQGSLSAGSNYALSYTGGDFTITARALNVSATGVNKVYDGTTAASVTYSDDRITGDVLSVAGSASFADKNVGTAKTVTVNGIALSGTDAGNYTLTGNTATASADITVRPQSNWIGGATGNWSLAENWDALPDGSNVLAATVPNATTVTYDALAGTTNLTSLTAGGLTITGGSLNIANTLTVNTSFGQSGGTLAFGNGASADITQASGDLNVPAMQVDSLALNALTGAIGQSGAIVATTLSTQSATGTTLNNTGNGITNFSASNNGSGDIALTNVGALSIDGISNSGGAVSVDNTGAVVTVGLVSALNNAVSIVAHSPLTIGAGGVSAGGNITLTAGDTSGAGDDLVLAGPVSATAAGATVALSGGDNLRQNANVTANGGAISALAQNGDIVMALGASTVSNGGSIGYAAQAGNISLTSLDAGANGTINLAAGGNVGAVAGFTGPNLIAGSAVIAASGDANLTTKASKLDVTVGGLFTLVDSTSGNVVSNVPGQTPEPEATKPVVEQVVSTIVATTEPTSTTEPTPTTTSVDLNALPATGAGGSASEETGGESGTFGATNGGKSDEEADDEKKDNKEADAGTKKEEEKSTEKKLKTCG